MTSQGIKQNLKMRAVATRIFSRSYIIEQFLSSVPRGSTVLTRDSQEPE